MTLTEIYEEYSTGDSGFIKAVSTHCGLECSWEEIERIAAVSPDPKTFEVVWENEDFWKDENQ